MMNDEPWRFMDLKKRLGVTSKVLSAILKELEACRKRISQIALQSKAVERVYRLNLQFFPLTWGEDKDEEGR